MSATKHLKMLLTVLSLSLFSGAIYAAPPMPDCAQVRSDLEVCLFNWALPTGESGTNIRLYYSTYVFERVNGFGANNIQERKKIETYTIPAQIVNRPGNIVWYYGSGNVKGVQMTVGVRRDFSTASSLPTLQFPSTLQYYNETSPNDPASWVKFQDTADFYLSPTAK